MICPNCGKENEEGVKFCTDCGTPIPVPEFAEQAENTPAEPDQVSYTAKAESTEKAGETIVEEQPAAVVLPPIENTPNETPQQSAPVQPVADSRSLLTTAQYFFLTVLFSIPLIGLIFMFVWGCGKPSNISLKRYSLAMLIFRLVAWLLSLVGTIITLLGINGMIPGFSIHLPFLG